MDYPSTSTIINLGMFAISSLAVFQSVTSSKRATESNELAAENLAIYKKDIEDKNRKRIYVTCYGSVYYSNELPKLPVGQSPTHFINHSNGFMLVADLQNNGVAINIKAIGLHIECNGKKLDTIPMRHKDPMQFKQDAKNDAGFALNEEAIKALVASNKLKVWFEFSETKPDEIECPKFELEDRSIRQLCYYVGEWQQALYGVQPLYSYKHEYGKPKSLAEHVHDCRLASRQR